MSYISTAHSTSSNLKIERAQGSEATRNQIIDVVCSRKKLSEMYFGGFRSNLPRLYDLWRGSWTGRFHPHKNNVHIPLIFSAIWADAARKAATSLNQYPIITFQGYGPSDAQLARKREALISAQMRDDDVFLKQTHVLVASDLYGKAIMQLGWKRKKETRIVEFVDKMPLSGRTVRRLQKGELVSFDGPVSEHLDLLDCFPQPGVVLLSNMKWFIRRYFLDLEEVRYLASEGVFSTSELARLEREGGANAHVAQHESMTRRFAIRSGMDDESIRWMDRYLRPIEIFEMWGALPSELCPDGVTWRVVTVANSNYLLRNKPNPFWHNLIPFVDYSPTPDIHYFYGPGKAEVVEKLQIVGNRYINQSLDAADLLIDPMWFYDRGANINTRNLYARPGRWIGVDGNPDTAIKPMDMNLQGLTLADSKIAQIREFVQMGTSVVEDAVQGLPGGDRQTAREFIGRREAAGTRLLLETRLYESCMLEKMADMFVALDKQFLETPVEILILGDGAMYDPVTKQPIQGSRENLGALDLVPNYAARAVGATSALSKGMKQERLLQLLQALASPLGQVAMGQINAINFFRSIFREFEIDNIDEIFATSPALGGMVQQQSPPGQGLGGVPTSGQIVNGSSPLGLPGMQEEEQPMTLQNTLPPM